MAHHVICGNGLLEDLWQQALGLQVGVLIGEVEHQKGAVVGPRQPRGEGQDALLQVSHCRKAAQLFEGHYSVLQRDDRVITAGLA